MNKIEKVYSVIGKRIKEERKKLNLTQEELADKLNMNYKFLSRIESSAERPSLEMIIRLASALNVSFVSLFIEGKDKKQLKSIKDKVQYLFPELSDSQQEHIITIIKETKSLLK